MSNALHTTGIEAFGDELRITFGDFSPADYQRFLMAKRLPEYRVEFDRDTFAHAIYCPARFASMLGVEIARPDAGWLSMADHLFDDQRSLVQLALDAARFAIWAECGLGKTPMGFEWARQVVHRTGGRVLIFTLGEVVGQFMSEAFKFYGSTLPIARLVTREGMKRWAATGVDEDGGTTARIAVTNYEKLNHRTDADQVVSELRCLAGVWADESSRLKTGGGRQKWAMIKSCRGIEYKLSTTATPAPNHVMEFASQAAFLEKIRDTNEVIWTYFTRDPKTHRWQVKDHALNAFFEFLAGWSIYVRDPKRYGWRKDLPCVPVPKLLHHAIEPTGEQQSLRAAMTADQTTGQADLFATNDVNAMQRVKLAQVARGFVYRNGDKGRRVQPVKSRKPAFVADLVRDELSAGLQVLVWTEFDAEVDILHDLLDSRGVVHAVITGRTPKGDGAGGREAIMGRFCDGSTPVLVTRASMLGFGRNFQNCGSMVFSGFNSSFEQFYQAVRRAVRFGQTRSVRVHVPYVRGLEEAALETVLHKDAEFEAGIERMEKNFIAAYGRTGLLATEATR